MNRSSPLSVASFALALMAFGPAAEASTIASVSPSAFEAVGALASRVLEPALQSARLAGSGITDATVTPPSAVPEPESFALLGLGLAAMVVARRKARKND